MLAVMCADLADVLRRRAGELGFVRVGFARAERLAREGEWLSSWLEAGRHGHMSYMQRTAAVRSDPCHAGMLPAARSVVVVAAAYARASTGADSFGPGRVARYARGRDYHNVLHRRLRKLAAVLRAPGHVVRVGVDTLPILERAWAVRAGLGFIGKNCNLIVPGVGSHVLLGVLVTDAELPPDVPLREGCGSCSLCLQACPTRAFVAARQLDARRCISYLTIEQPGAPAPELRAGIGGWVFGCDECQDVCPYNRGRYLAPDHDTAPFAPDGRLARHRLADLISMDATTFEGEFQGSPMRRPGRDGMARNAAVVLGNLGARRHLAVLRQAAVSDDSPAVRDVAAWAAAAIEARE